MWEGRRVWRREKIRGQRVLPSLQRRVDVAVWACVFPLVFFIPLITRAAARRRERRIAWCRSLSALKQPTHATGFTRACQHHHPTKEDGDQRASDV